MKKIIIGFVITCSIISAVSAGDNSQSVQYKSAEDLRKEIQQARDEGNQQKIVRLCAQLSQQSSKESFHGCWLKTNFPSEVPDTQK